MWQWNILKWLRQRKDDRLSRICPMCILEGYPAKVWPSRRALGSHKKAHSPKPVKTQVIPGMPGAGSGSLTSGQESQ